MTPKNIPLQKVYEGWEGNQVSLVDAINPLSSEQLLWRPAPQLRSVGELAMHMSMGRVIWFQRMNAPGSEELALRLAAGRRTPQELERDEAIYRDARALVGWLETSWEIVSRTLKEWTVADLDRTFRDSDEGKVWIVSYQWAIWRVLSHDLHHGGEIAALLGIQGVPIPELGDQGGHLVEPPLVES